MKHLSRTVLLIVCIIGFYKISLAQQAEQTFTWPDGNWLSHTSRPFEIAKKLRELDHKVMFAAEGQYMKLPHEAGFDILPIKTIDPERVLKCSRNGRANWFDYDLIKTCVQAELDLFESEQPDLIPTNFRLTLSTSCELAKLPDNETRRTNNWNSHNA